MILKKYKICFLFSIMLLSFALMFACNKDTEKDEEIIQTIKLAIPQIELGGYELKWDAVENAEKYQIFINGEKIFEQDGLKYVISNADAGDYNIKIKAVSSNEKYNESDFSNEVKCTVLPNKLAAPVITLKDSEVTWEKIINAEKYEIYVDDEKLEEITENKYLLEVTEIGIYTITVKAVSISINYSESNLSNEIKYSIYGGAVATPVLTLDGKTVSWNVVPNAEEYQVYINNKLKSTVTALSYIIEETAVGEYSVTVKAVTSNQLFLDSGISNSVTYKAMPFELGEIQTNNVSGSINLSDSLENTDVLYWEHYGSTGLDMKYNAEDLILSNSIENSNWYFYDYQAGLSWINGTINRTYINNTTGRCSSENITVRVKINENVKK